MHHSQSKDQSGVYVERRGTAYGPFTAAQIRRFATDGILRPTDMLALSLHNPQWTRVADAAIYDLCPEGVSARKNHPSKDPPNRTWTLASLLQHAKGFMDEARQEIDTREHITVTHPLTFGRTSPPSHWVIHHPDVSRVHAEFSRNEKGLIVRDLKSRTGIAINGTRISPLRPTLLHPGDSVAIGPAILKAEHSGLHVISTSGHAHIHATHLSKDVHSPTGLKRILNAVTLELKPSSFYVIIGPSGSGKSTLLKALNGRGIATHGHVTLNGENLYANYEALRTRMATVPQKDLLHESLTVKRALMYTAQLRLPNDLTPVEKRQRVTAVMTELGIDKFSNSLINTLSGGQTKRVSLGNELLSQPSLVFIDEATSGLDESSDRDVMQLLRGLANAGRTVVCVTHNVGNIEATATHVIVMASGGYLAYLGPPSEALAYFSASSFADIYAKLAIKPGREWDREFRKHSNTSDATLDSRVSKNVAIHRQRPSAAQHVGQAMRHGRVIALRMLELLAADKVTLLVSIAQPACVCALIILVFGSAEYASPTEQYLEQAKITFLLGISAFWLGCNNAAKEIVKEKGIYERELNSGLSSLGYYAAKLAVLSATTSVQTVALVLVVIPYTGLSGGAFTHAAVSCIIAYCGVTLGLLISVISRNTDVAATAVPLAIIPQVILSGGVTMLSGVAQTIAAWTSPSYWAFGAMTNHLYWSLFESDELKDRLLPMMCQMSVSTSTAAIIAFSTMFMAFAVASLSSKGAWCTRAARPNK